MARKKEIKEEDGQYARWKWEERRDSRHKRNRRRNSQLERNTIGGTVRTNETGDKEEGQQEREK